MACVLRRPETAQARPRVSCAAGRRGTDRAQGHREVTGHKDTEGEKLCTKAEASTKLCKKEAGGGHGVGQSDSERFQASHPQGYDTH